MAHVELHCTLKELLEFSDLCNWKSGEYVWEWELRHGIMVKKYKFGSTEFIDVG